MGESASEATVRLFERLAAFLAPGSPPPDDDEEARAILARLEYLPVDKSSSHETMNRIALLKAAGRFSRVFQLVARDAPGVTFFGAEVSPAIVDLAYRHREHASASGAGLSVRQAFESCIGEGVEYLSQFETRQDQVHAASIVEGLSSLDTASRKALSALMRWPADGAAGTIDWIAATRLSNGLPVQFPADLCLRRAPERAALSPPFRLSCGCAAGPSFEVAALHGMLELIERDAVSLWWRGGARGRLVPLEEDAILAAASLVAQMRQGSSARKTWLLDITTDLGVPVVVAISGRSDGRGFACGLAARLTLQSATRSALVEMCQMELAYELVEAKRRERGDEALNEYDRQHIDRSTLIDTATCELLHPAAPARSIAEITASTPLQQFEALVARLSDKGIETFTIDLTRPAFAVPVVRVIAPALQLEPCEVATERLVSTQARTGGGGGSYTKGVNLL